LESELHKHYKNNLLCKGMQILSCGELLTILDFETEVNLNKKFNTNWNKNIIVDILAKTNKGYIVIEIYKTNPKLWAELADYYNYIADQVINLFEVKVSNIVNQLPIWKDRKLLLKEDNRTELYDSKVLIGDFYFGINSKPYRVNDTIYQIKCVERCSPYSKYSNIVTIQFDLANKYITEKRLYSCFGNITGLIKSQFNYIRISDKLYQCVSFYNPHNTGFSKYDQKMIQKIRKQLENMKPQNKIIYAKE